MGQQRGHWDGVWKICLDFEIALHSVAGLDWVYHHTLLLWRWFGINYGLVAKTIITLGSVPGISENKHTLV